MPTEGDFTAERVRSLLRDQHLDLADLEICFGAEGWDCQLWRLGENLAVRLPYRNSSADELILKEHTWLPTLAPLLSQPVPIPQRLGLPTRSYGHYWTVTTWVPGSPADRAPATSTTRSADDLAAFLASLHRPAPANAPDGRGRGGNLLEVAAGVERGFDQLRSLCEAVARSSSAALLDIASLRAIWQDALEAPAWSGDSVWLHGDLHPANVLTVAGEICGVVDFGDLCAGDPALDIASCWILLPNLESIEQFRRVVTASVDDAGWRRARGWAIWRAFGSLRVATDAGQGGKPTWGPPALASLRLLAEVERPEG